MTDRSTFPTLLAEQVRGSGARPLVTFYDDATGERVELSVTTYANWVAKTASLLQDELDAVRGQTVLVELPTHWLAPVWLGAAWSLGLAVSDDRDVGHDLVVCGPEELSRHAAGEVPVVALSLLPLGARFADPLPPGVVDFGAVVWGQPDVLVAVDPPERADVAWRAAGGSLTQGDVLEAAASGSWGEPGTRLLTDLPPCSTEGLAAFVGPLLAGGGTVWVAHADPAAWDQRMRTENATRALHG